MKAKEIAFVVYGVKNLSKGREFYEQVLKLTPGNVWQDGDMGLIEYEMGEHTLSIGAGVPEFQPGGTGGVVALEVEDFDQAVKELKDHGVKFILEPHETSVRFMATFEDPDGNRLMLHKRKSNKE